MKYLHLCLHTLRADCNGLSIVRMKLKCTFASTRSVQIATVKSIGNRLHTIFASTRSVQIATSPNHPNFPTTTLFASTRSVQIATDRYEGVPHYYTFASTRSVQIATAEMHRIAICTFQNVC